MSRAFDTSPAGPSGRVRDATDRNWVDRFAPAPWRPFLRLSRADRPIGTWLLLIPCWWAVLLAAGHGGWQWFDLWLILGSGIGAVLMRGAGCTWNDITDRDIDDKVARTRSRPIPSGAVSPRQALAWAVAQSLAAFLILITFNWTAIGWGVASLIPVAVYPFAKRFTWWPQIFLGIAFNWGALLLWVAQSGSFHPAAGVLWLMGIAWTLHYDTIYAHQDREDDALIGVKSTARLFEERTVAWLWGFVAAVAGLGGVALALAGAGLAGWLGLAAMTGFMARQTLLVDIDDTDRCLTLFRATRWGGLLLAAGLALDLVI